MRCHAVILAAAMAWLISAGFAEARLEILVDKGSQRMMVIQDGYMRYLWPVSTGRDQMATPSGVYSPQRMERNYFSKEYYDSPMPFAIFFHNGYAIHGSNAIDKLGGPASHGCVRLHPHHAELLFDLVQQEGPGNTVIEVADQARPDIATAPSPEMPPQDIPARDVIMPRDMPPADIPLRGVPSGDVSLREAQPRGIPVRELPPRDIVPPRDAAPRGVPLRDMPPREVMAREPAYGVPMREMPPREMPRELPARGDPSPREMSPGDVVLSRDAAPRGVPLRDMPPREVMAREPVHGVPMREMPPREMPRELPARGDPSAREMSPRDVVLSREAPPRNIALRDMPPPRVIEAERGPYPLSPRPARYREPELAELAPMPAPRAYRPMTRNVLPPRLLDRRRMPTEFSPPPATGAPRPSAIDPAPGPVKAAEDAVESRPRTKVAQLPPPPAPPPEQPKPSKSAEPVQASRKIYGFKMLPASCWSGSGTRWRLWGAGQDAACK